MKSKFFKALTLCLAFAGMQASAQEDPKALIESLLQDKFGIDVAAIEKAPFDGFHEVLTTQGVIYVSDDGQFLMQGTLLDIKNQVNLTQMSRMKMDQALWAGRKEGLKELEDSMIVFPAKNEKYTVTVFTDITCGYCRKMHSEIESYNDLGITVRYLAYPRNGLFDQNSNPTPNYTNTQQVWCSSDKQQALTDAKERKPVSGELCKNKVAEHYNFGRKSGVSGTPALVLDNGMLIPGYKPAKDLKEMLEMLANS